MAKYITRRLLSLIPILLGIIFLIMAIMSLIPGSPGLVILGPDAPAEAVEALDHELGYDQPFLVRFVTYVGNLLHGDLGTSYRTSRTVWYEISRRLPTSVTLAVLAVGFAMIVAIPLGILSAVKQYSFADISLTTIVCIPSTLLALAIVAALGGGLIKVLVALILANIPVYTRVIRSTILNVTEQDYIQAAKASGTPDWLIILKHVLPNAIGVIIVQATMTFGDVIITASTMSFLGLGIQPPTPEWGSMLSEGKNFMLYSTSIMFFPGAAIVLTALSLNLLGDGLRDALDPRLRN